jgi:hypothetical protein
MTAHTPPERYKVASDIGKPFLRLLGISEDDLDRECRLVMEDNGYIHDAYLWTACKYLWRMGDKDDVSQEIVKALDYLRWFRDRKYVDRLDGVTWNVHGVIAGLEALQVCLSTSKSLAYWGHHKITIGNDTIIPGEKP